MQKSRDTRSRAVLLVNAYVEALVGVFALRLPMVKQIVSAQAPKMAVASSDENMDVILDAKEVVDACGLHGQEVVAVIEQITSAFVAAMWDTLISHAHYDVISTKPEVQFFRHLRNACGHNGCWNFTELKHEASWRQKRLSLQHAGRPVFNGLLKHGDVMLLFRDIDLKYFEQ